MDAEGNDEWNGQAEDIEAIAARNQNHKEDPGEGAEFSTLHHQTPNTPPQEENPYIRKESKEAKSEEKVIKHYY